MALSCSIKSKRWRIIGMAFALFPINLLSQTTPVLRFENMKFSNPPQYSNSNKEESDRGPLLTFQESGRVIDFEKIPSAELRSEALAIAWLHVTFKDNDKFSDVNLSEFEQTLQKYFWKLSLDKQNAILQQAFIQLIGDSEFEIQNEVLIKATSNDPDKVTSLLCSTLNQLFKGQEISKDEIRSQLPGYWNIISDLLNFSARYSQASQKKCTQGLMKKTDASIQEILSWANDSTPQALKKAASENLSIAVSRSAAWPDSAPSNCYSYLESYLFDVIESIRQKPIGAKAYFQTPLPQCPLTGVIVRSILVDPQTKKQRSGYLFYKNSYRTDNSVPIPALNVQNLMKNLYLTSQDHYLK